MMETLRSLGSIFGALPPELAQGGAVATLAGIALAFYRYVWKPQQDRMDAFVANRESKLEDEIDELKTEMKADREHFEGRLRSVEGELDLCRTQHRQEREVNARLRLALIQANIPIPGE